MEDVESPHTDMRVPGIQALHGVLYIDAKHLGVACSLRLSICLSIWLPIYLSFIMLYTYIYIYTCIYICMYMYAAMHVCIL